MDFARLLSPSQHEAATLVDAPVCILAGAGSGKTRVVTHRIAYLIHEKRRRPWTILAVTFTNKAAGEMRHRVDQLVPGAGSDVQIGTFHGMSARLLRRHGRSVGVPPGFVIYDADDAERLLKRVVVDEMNVAKDAVRPIKRYIEGWQGDGLLPDEVPEVAWNPFEERARQAYALYAERLQGMQAVDFGGLLLKLRDLLRLPVGEDVRQRVQHLLVDEYQDTNAVQAEIVLMLAKTAETVAVVGDDDQAIYGWRGATADNLKRFLDAMPGARLVKLEDNYRSTRAILAAANGVISHNEARLGKTLRPTGEEGRPVRVLKCASDIEEARRVVRELQELRRGGRSLEDTAILYRTNAVSRPFEEELRRQRISYRLVGGVRFYDRKEVKDVLATLRSALNPASDVDTVRMVTAVPRGIGESSLEKISTAARGRRLPIAAALEDEALLEAAGVPKRSRNACLRLADDLATLRARVDPEGEGTVSAKDAIALAIEVSGVADRLEAESTVEAEGRLENLEELLNAAAQFVTDAEASGQPAHALGFLEAAALLGGNESENEEGEAQEKVTLMTLHAAKGLEYGAVFLVGLEEHGFPHTRAITEDAPASELEEERRLAYVGITRAKERLTLTWAQRRMVRGDLRPRTASRFLRELPADGVEGDRLVPGRGKLAFSPGFLDDDEPRPAGDGPPLERVEYDDEAVRERRQRALKGALGRRGLSAPAEPTFSLDEPCRPAGPATPAVPAAAAGEGLAEGMRVTHAAFGEGTLVGFRGVGTRRAALVRFDGARAPRVIIATHLAPLGSHETHVSSQDPEEDDEEPRVVYDEAGGA